MYMAGSRRSLSQAHYSARAISRSDYEHDNTLSMLACLSKSSDGLIRHASWVCIGYTGLVPNNSD